MSTTHSTKTTQTYTIEPVTQNFSLETYRWLRSAIKKVTDDHVVTYNPELIGLSWFIKNCRFVICRRNGKPVGYMVSRLIKSAFNPEIKRLRQISLYAEPNTRAAYYLMKDFIDFGKIHADHIITTIGMNTNIKRKSIEKLGFEKIEEHYLMKVEK